MTPEIEYLVEMVGACGDDVGEVMGYYQRGHVPPFALRKFVEYECPWAGPTPWPKREWWRDVPYSFMYPDEPPCGDREAILFVPCKRTDAGAYPVTVLRVKD